jgi:type IV pilus assembly protein PilA
MTRRCRSRARPRPARERRSGFTLIEVMITVAIVGVLAMIAVVGYRKIINSSRTVEATHMVAAVREAQERYHAEVGRYANVSVALAANQATHHAALYPHAASGGSEPGSYKIAWGLPCPGSACLVDWTVLGVQPDGPVYYGYSTVSGGARAQPSDTVTIGGTAVAFPASPDNDWYLVTAVGDVDGNGVFSTVLGTSFDNEVRIDMDGE